MSNEPPLCLVIISAGGSVPPVVPAAVVLRRPHVVVQAPAQPGTPPPGPALALEQRRMAGLRPMLPPLFLLIICTTGTAT